MSKEDFLYRESIRKLLKRINKNCDAIIVEGKDDVKVLRRLGVSVRIFRSANRPDEEFCDTVAHASERVVILTDFDSEGKEIARNLGQILREEIDVMNSYRKEFGKLLTSKDRYCIEDLRPLMGKEFDRFDEAKLSRMYSDLG